MPLARGRRGTLIGGLSPHLSSGHAGPVLLIPDSSDGSDNPMHAGAKQYTLESAEDHRRQHETRQEEVAENTVVPRVGLDPRIARRQPQSRFEAKQGDGDKKGNRSDGTAPPDCGHEVFGHGRSDGKPEGQRSAAST